MNKILIGSKALKFWFPNFNRIPKDIDYVVDEHYTGIKKEGVEYLYNPILFEGNYASYMSGEFIATPTVLLTLKMSHVVCRDIAWKKHVWDVQFLLDMGIVPSLPLFYKLYEFWNTNFPPNKRSNLAMTSKEFFDNALPKTILSHDQRHVILNPIPIYTKILKDGAEVEVCEEKFNQLSFEDKLSLVYEELENMEEERFKHLPVRIGWSKMLKDFVLKHAPVWESIFILENFKTLHIPRRDHRSIINKAIEELKK